MHSFRFRRRLERFEDRLTPAVAADITGAAAQTMAGAAFFEHVINGDPEWMFNPSLQSFVQQKLQEVFQQSQAAAATFESLGGSQMPFGGMEGVALANVALAQQLGDWIGVAVAPAVPTPPAPTPTDAGMTSTMPDPNDANWIALGGAGLKTWDVVQGTGDPVAAGDTLEAFYTGWLAANGTQFDARRSPNPPASFALTSGAGGVIDGWVQGIPGMKPGGIRRLYIPAALAYGAAGRPPSIPANADLIFEVKLISHT
jgi:hypothetical protein